MTHRRALSVSRSNQKRMYHLTLRESELRVCCLQPSNQIRRTMERNMSARNFGLRSRDAGRALYNAYLQNGNSYKTNADAKNNLASFAKYLKDEHSIKDLRKLEHSHVESYAAHLLERYETGAVGADRITNQLSHVNQAIKNARCDQKLRVTGRDAGFPNKSGIALEDRSVSQHAHNTVKNQLSERLASQIELQRCFGLRFKESSLINAQSVLEQAKADGCVTIVDGTKGGRDREIPITSQEQIVALEAAAAIQGEWRSMVPADLSFAQYQDRCYDAVRHHDFKFHGERHAYAHNRYHQITGAQSALQAGVEHKDRHAYLAEKLNVSKAEAKEIDHTARMQISNELGHARLSITNKYLG